MYFFLRFSKLIKDSEKVFVMEYVYSWQDFTAQKRKHMDYVPLANISKMGTWFLFFVFYI